MPIPMGKGGGLGLIVIVLILAVCVAPRLVGGGGGLGGDVFSDLNDAGTGQAGLDPANDPDLQLFEQTETVFAYIEDFWPTVFEGSGRTFTPAQMVIFRNGVSTACGQGSSATGPFYCPADSRIYIDLGFFRELEQRFGAPGDFAQAYVVAHEYGHHIQNLLGINRQVQEASQQDPERANDLSVRLELQADCLAGVWGHSLIASNELSDGDLEEALNAASAIGDDRIQQSTTGRVDPESWTHGSSEQRMRWFKAGFNSGDLNACETFDTDI